MKPVEADYDPQRVVIEAIQAGDAHAMAEFMESQGRWVRGVVFGVLGRLSDLDDVCQRVWIKVWREGHRLEDPARWRPWLYRIARNAAMDALRASRRRRRWFGPTIGDDPAIEVSVAGHSPAPDRQLAMKEEHERMLTAIAQLPPLCREPFVLKHVEGWSYAEIGEVLGLPTDTVETRLVRARRLLREGLAGRLG
ncbi:MAG: RNA polymerase sigma factor [Planctomycetes bacterium]|nr:RNA polymerase sigma factor [Planctomycetota bacterium]